MRPSKLRLPERILVSSSSSATACIGSKRGPELPIQLMQPQPQTEKPICASGSTRPARERISVVLWEPGAKTFLTQGSGTQPSSRAFFATRPAAIIMAGSVAVVQLVTAAMPRAPCVSAKSSPSNETVFTVSCGARPCCANESRKRCCKPETATRLCGREGPAKEGSIEERSISITCE